MKLTPSLYFNGQCETAFKFYEQFLGGKVKAMLPFEGSPMAEEVPPEWRQKIMHAHLTISDQELMGSDCPPGYYQEPQGFAVALQFDDPAEAERVFDTLVDKGKVLMPLEETFWASRFGMLVDRFGIPWMINCDKVGLK
ncbi:MAG: VOC family protein [Chloroflexaceae bacterium]|nr:VOC family protein [Chloroflexaceae bacterium]